MNFKNIIIWVGILFYIFFIIIDLILVGNLFQNPMNQIFIVLVPITSSIIISFTPGIYHITYKRSKLKLDLENSREFLIQIFDTQFSRLERTNLNRIESAVTISPGEESTEKSKYLRINLRNKGKKTAENCSIKLYIYYWDFSLVREPSSIYPAGYHHIKSKKEPPPLIDIAAGDFQIYDICSTTNRTGYTRLIRFEDHFTHSRIEARNRPLFIRKIYYIKLFVYSDNNSPIEKYYIIFLDSSIKGLNWKRINIKEFNWERYKKKKALDAIFCRIIMDIKTNKRLNILHRIKKLSLWKFKSLGFRIYALIKDSRFYKYLYHKYKKICDDTPFYKMIISKTKSSENKKNNIDKESEIPKMQFINQERGRYISYYKRKFWR